MADINPAISMNDAKMQRLLHGLKDAEKVCDELTREEIAAGCDPARMSAIHDVTSSTYMAHAKLLTYKKLNRSNQHEEPNL